MKQLAPLTLAALLVAALPGRAAEIDGSTNLLCAAQLAVDCGRDGVCEQGMPEGLNIPPFFALDLAADRIRAARPDGSEVDTAIASKTLADGQMILQGAENGRGWSATIAQDTGHLVVSVSAEDVAFVVFGACTAQP